MCSGTRCFVLLIAGDCNVTAIPECKMLVEPEYAVWDTLALSNYPSYDNANTEPIYTLVGLPSHPAPFGR